MNNFPAAVIWDLDGTLIDSAPDLATALNVLLRENNRPALHTDTVRTMIGDGVAAKDMDEQVKTLDIAEMVAAALIED